MLKGVSLNCDCHKFFDSVWAMSKEQLKNLLAECQKWHQPSGNALSSRWVSKCLWICWAEFSQSPYVFLGNNIMHVGFATLIFAVRSSYSGFGRFIEVCRSALINILRRQEMADDDVAWRLLTICLVMSFPERACRDSVKILERFCDSCGRYWRL